jgi:hypothetical protein
MHQTSVVIVCSVQDVPLSFSWKSDRQVAEFEDILKNPNQGDLVFGEDSRSHEPSPPKILPFVQPNLETLLETHRILNVSCFNHTAILSQLKCIVPGTRFACV